jgi:adenylate cyclase
MNKQFDVNELNKKYLELETLLDITNELNSFEDIATLLQEILIKSCAVLNASSGIILIKDYNSDLFQIEAEFNIDVSVLKGIIFKKNKGFFNELNKNRKSLLLEISSDPFLIKTNCTYGLITPLVDKKDLLGVLILFDKESRTGISVFDDSDANMLSAIATQAAVSYNNIKLLENIKEAKTFNDNVMESIVTGVFTTNLMGEINHINKAASKIINLEREQVIGNHYEYVFESNDLINELLFKCEEEVKTISSTDVQLICNGKNTTVNISVSPLLNDLNEPIGSVVAMEDLSNLDKLKSTFKKYVSKQIVDKLLENEDLLNLGGQELTVTTLFSDIRGFTRMSENMQPIDVVKTLNAYFDLMIEVVFKFDGTLDKIIGDELMVIYGAPIPGHDDTKRALFTALEMQRLLEDFNDTRKKVGANPIEIGIGINRGKTIAGNIGSKEQMNYTVIGDAVNLASRLCSNAKSGQILVSESVYLEVVDYGIFDFQRLDSIFVKGK